ncbi:sugar phosphate nucleotidyltransferase [Chitinilyticum piscinae]|uniref:NDP-sugar synthase n=1 Tax=Chitinilyticum piscinae TaxID=2866724 RepID=A0A8J7G194_9NEIS|nr:NDP-sugar synthase [Chitinilyticum piscinae]MBE9609548.1 NDP-sugar synthase [Chitinilyticum piscinae]
MKALILAAGKGTRLMPLSRDIPKPMLPILDRPVLECLIEQLARHGVDQIIINTSYLAGEIEGYFHSGRRFGVELAFSYEGYERDGQLIDTPLGSAGTLRAIQQHSGFFDDTFLVLCGDALIDLDLTALIAAHHRNGALATLALNRVPEQKLSQYGVALLDETDRIMAFQEKPKPGEARSNLANTGVYVFEPQIMQYIPPDTPYDLGSDVFPQLAREGLALYGTELPFDWVDIGRVADYYAVQMRALRGELPAVSRPGREIAPGVFAGANCRIDPRRCHIQGQVVLADSVTIEDGATLIGPLWIGRGSIVERGAHVERSLIFDYTRVGTQALLVEKLASGRWCARADGLTVDPAASNIPWILADSRTPRSTISAKEQHFLEEINALTPAPVRHSSAPAVQLSAGS